MALGEKWVSAPQPAPPAPHSHGNCSFLGQKTGSLAPEPRMAHATIHLRGPVMTKINVERSREGQFVRRNTEDVQGGGEFFEVFEGIVR